MNTIDTSTRILVGVDGSGPSIDALRRAATIAAVLDAPIEAVITWDYPAMLGMYDTVEVWSPENEAIDKAFPDGPPARLTRLVRRGPAARVLIEESANAYLLVLGSRGHGGFTGLLLGSVSAACAEHAQCPVLIMHKPKAEAVG